MTSVSGHSFDRPKRSDGFPTFVRPAYKPDASVTRIDIALLASALFLQRFAVPYGNTFVPLELVAIGLILSYQFVAGKLVVPYDRLLWFLGLALALTGSLLLNFQSTMVPAYFFFVAFFALLSLNRPSTIGQFKA